MSPIQCRAARAGISWSVVELATKAGVNKNTIVNFENGKDAYTSTAEKLKKALESTKQVRFEGDNGVFFIGQEVGEST